MSTGYVGAPRGRKNCCDLGMCLREKYHIPSGERYELCRSVHAEANAIIAVSRKEMLGATLYLACRDPKDGAYVPGTTCCSMCKRMIINSGIAFVITWAWLSDTKEWYYRTDFVRDWVWEDDTV